MKKTLLDQYARLTVRVGVNVQKGQQVVVRAAVDQAPLVESVVRECYRAGASHVEVDWQCDPVTKLAWRHETVTRLSEVTDWQKAKLDHRLKTLPCMIYIVSEDPDAMKGISQKKMQKVRQNRFPVIKPYHDAMDNRYAWTIVGAPSAAWAKKVFPSLRRGAAVEKLWQAILKTVGVDGTADPVEVWAARNAEFDRRCRVMNGYRFAKLHYHSANGTDFSAELLPNVKWAAGGETTLSGQFFNPNLPTEEVFTTPCRGKAEGRLVATKPLSYSGQLIEDFWLEFENGRVARFDAAQGRETLDKLVSTDDGAAMLGELALVPQSSPISQMGFLFYNTLYDENASCHAALGRGFSNLLEGFENMTPAEWETAGINDSMVHVDFMIGADDLAVTGETADGARVPLLVNGEWVI